jgi:hypothetical protein
VLRNVSTTIGMPGEEIVPSEDQIEQMTKQQQEHDKSGGNIDELIQQAVNKGVEAGVKRITTELTSGILAQREQMPEGKPTHIGTLGGQSTMSDPGMEAHTGAPGPQDAARAQGMQPSQLSQSMGPQTHLTGSQPGAGAKAVSGGVG